MEAHEVTGREVLPVVDDGVGAVQPAAGEVLEPVVAVEAATSAPICTTQRQTSSGGASMVNGARRDEPGSRRISSPGRRSRVSSVVAPQCRADQRSVTTDRSAAPATTGATTGAKSRLMRTTVVRAALAGGAIRPGKDGAGSRLRVRATSDGSRTTTGQPPKSCPDYDCPRVRASTARHGRAHRHGTPGSSHVVPSVVVDERGPGRSTAA